MGTEPEFVVLKRIPNGTRNGVPAGSIVDASNWRNLRSLIANGFLIPVGDSKEEVLAEARNIRRGGPLAQASLVKLATRANAHVENPLVEATVKATADIEVPEEEDELAEYESSPGWYKVPGVDKNLRREEALVALGEVDLGSSDEADSEGDGESDESDEEE